MIVQFSTLTKDFEKKKLNEARTFSSHSFDFIHIDSVGYFVALSEYMHA